MPTIRLIVEYDGSCFHGWQMQEGLITVQSELHRVLELVLREKISVVHASGRTDAGVHARGQVVTFVVSKVPDLHRLTHSVSSILKGALSVTDAAVVPDTFHPRRSAKKKQYSYTILHRKAPAVLDKGYVWHITADLDYEKMAEAASCLVGTHDFTSLRAAQCQANSPVKTILESELCLSRDYVVYRVVGKGFLQHMVRIIVGTLVDIGRGRLHSSMPEILAAKDRRVGGVTAPPFGLMLDWVEYDDHEAGADDEEE